MHVLHHLRRHECQHQREELGQLRIHAQRRRRRAHLSHVVTNQPEPQLAPCQPHVVGQRAVHAVVDQNYSAVFADQNITRVGIAVNKAVDENHTAKDSLDARSYGPGISTDGFQTRLVVHAHTVAPLLRQHARAGERGVHARDLELVRGEFRTKHLASFIGVACFLAEVQLVTHVPSGLPRQPREAQSRNEVREERVVELDGCEVNPQEPRHRPLLDFDGDRLPCMRASLVNLRERG
mmetsp:Transcript_38376/g.95340  ORF Transcript_38376/g.95340 Transcript_38376/m.95340 type:complete len:237 (+) Transcript_38376:906-1616(+)